MSFSRDSGFAAKIFPEPAHVSLRIGLVRKIYALVSLSTLASPLFRRNLDVDRSNADVKDSNLNAEFPSFLDDCVKRCSLSNLLRNIVKKLRSFIQLLPL